MPGNDRYPPLPEHELRDAHGFDNIERVVVTQHGVYGRRRDGTWAQFVPLAAIPVYKATED